MLKIKGNVDLKELEKFGFEKYIDVYRYEIKKSTQYVIPCVLCVGWDRKLIIETAENITTNNLDIIFDLIQAGLVEKF